MPENNNNDQPLDFAEKVLQSLKRQSRAVDLNEVKASSTKDFTAEVKASSTKDFTALGAQEAGGGPGSGGNKDIVIIPGYGGVAASSVSQVNFYWNAPATPDSTGIDSNVRATLYNYAITATRPTLVIGGYDGTNQYKPQSDYGTGTGITAKIWFHPFIGRVDADQFGFNTIASTGVSTLLGILTWDTSQNKIRVGQGGGTAKTLAYTDDISPFSGSATTASNLNLANTAAATNHFLTMSASQTATGVAGAAISTVSTVFVVPNTGVLNATGFSGNVTGTVSGNVTGNVSGSVTGNVSGNLTGNVSGNVTGNVSGNVTGNLSGTAWTAGATHTNLTSAATAHYITFVNTSASQSASGVGQSIASNVTVIPNTGVVSAGGFSGNVTGTVSGNVTGNVSGSVTGNVSGNVTGNVSGNLTGNVSGNVTGNVSGSVTGNLAGTAWTAGATHTVVTTSASAHYISFVPTNATQTASGVGQSVATNVSVIPNTGVISAGGFSGNVTGTVSGNVTGNVSGSVTGNLSGNVTGNVSGSVTGNLSGNVTGNVSGSVTGNVSGNVTGILAGTAWTAGSTHTVVTTSASAHYLSFVPTNASQTASGVGQSIATNVSVIPNTGVITAGGFSGNVTGTVSGNVTGNVSGSVTGNLSGNVTGNVSGSVTGNLSGNVTGNVSGNLTGNVSGNVTGNVSGNLTGNVSGTATTAQNVNVLAADTATGNHFLPFVRVQTGSGLALSTDSTLYYDPTGNTLYSTNFNGAFTGTISGIASTASNLVVNNATTSSTHYLLFTPSQTGSGVAVSSDTTATINPATNAMSLGTGNLTANSVTVGSAARTVSTSTGNLILDSSGGQVDITDNVVITGNLTVQGTTITVDSTVSTIVDPVIVVGSGVGGSHSTADNNQDRGIEFRWATGGTATTGFFGFSDTDGKFRFIPNATTVAGSNVYTGTVGTIVSNLEGTVSGNVTGNVSGNLTGNVSGNVTGNVSGNVTGNLAGTAWTAGATHTVVTTSASAHYLSFVPTNATQTAAGVGQSIATNVSVIPNTGVITAGGFSGNVTGTVSGNVTGNVSGSVTGNVSGNLTGNVSGNVTGNVSGSVTGNLSGNVTGNVSGSVTGNVSGNLSGTAWTAGATHTVVTTSASAHYISFVPTNATQTASGVGQSIATNVSVIPNTGVITAGGFSGNVTGTVSGNVTGNVSGSLTGNVSGNLTGNVSGNVTGNVSGSVTGNVSGNLTGNVSGSVTGNLAGTAWTAGSVHTVVTTSASAHYMAFVPTNATQTASGVGQSIATNVSVIPNTGVITAGGFSGNVTGTVSGNVTGNVSGSVTGNLSGNVTGNVSGNLTGNVSGNVTGNVSGSVTGNLAGTAWTAGATHTVVTTSASAHYLTFVPTNASQTASGVGQSIATNVSVIPNTGVVTAGGFSGNVTGTVSGNVTGNISGSVTGNVSGNVTGNVSGSVTGNVSGNVTGNVSGNLTGNVTGFATTSSGTTLLNATSSTDHFPILAFSSTGVGVGLSSDADFKYNPSTNTLTAGLFAGTAQSVQSVIVNNAAASSDHFLLFSPSSSGSGIAVSADTSLKYVPSTDTLTVTNISPINVSSSAALSSGTYLKITTNVTDDNSTTDFFIRGLNSDGTTSKFSVDANGNLRATTKSFDIPHPTKEGKRLVYGVLEGPEHGVYHRGTVEGKGKLLVELPEYWTSLVNEDYSIQLTAWGNYAVHIVEKSPTSFIISANGNPFTQKYKNIKVDYIVHGSRKDAHLDIEQD